MNSLNYKLCDKIIPASYVRQGLEARKVLENRIMQLLEQACTSTCLYTLRRDESRFTSHVSSFLSKFLTVSGYIACFAKENVDRNLRPIVMGPEDINKEFTEVINGNGDSRGIMGTLPTRLFAYKTLRLHECSKS